MTEEDAAAVIGQAREFLTTVKQLLAEEGVGLILSQLARCVGALPASQKKLIGKLDLPKLEALGESLLEFKSRTDLSSRLKKNAS